jgi:hypothetical protein
MFPRLSVVRSAPLPVCTRALAALKCFARGQRNYTRVKPHAYRDPHWPPLALAQQERRSAVATDDP